PRLGARRIERDGLAQRRDRLLDLAAAFEIAAEDEIVGGVFRYLGPRCLGRGPLGRGGLGPRTRGRGSLYRRRDGNREKQRDGCQSDHVPDDYNSPWAADQGPKGRRDR